jgi:hypothetical protein
MQATFQRHHAPLLHEAGHAVIAVVFRRKLKELSRLEDQSGSGYVCCQMIDEPGKPALEEIAIALAGEEGPYLWGDWVTNCRHDQKRIEHIVSKHFQSQNANHVCNIVRPCVKRSLLQLRDAVAAVAHELSRSEGILSGEAAEAVIRCESFPPNIGSELDQCLAQVLQSLAE